MICRGVPQIWILAPDRDPLGAPGTDPLAMRLSAHLREEGAKIRLLSAHGAKRWQGGVPSSPLATMRGPAPQAIVALDPARTWALAALCKARAPRARLFCVTRGHELPGLDRAGPLARRVLRLTSTPCVTDRRAAPSLAAALEIPLANVRTLPLPPVDAPTLSPAPDLLEHHAHADEQLVVGCLGEHLDDAALDTVLEAVAPLTRRRPPHRLCLEIAVSATRARRLTRRAKERGLGLYLGSPPPPTPSHLPHFLRGLHVLLVPERSPLQVDSPALRAGLACGVPVIAASTPAARAWIRPGFNGLRLPDLDTGAWRRALARLLEMGPEARVWMARQAARTPAARQAPSVHLPPLLPTLCAPPEAA